MCAHDYKQYNYNRIGEKMKILKLMITLLLLFLHITYAQEELDKNPTVKGGVEQLAKNIKYPKIAKEAGIMGKVLVKAQIDEYGAVTETEIIDGINKDLDAAAIKAINQLNLILE